MKIGSLFFEIGAKSDDLQKSLEEGKKKVAIFAAEVLAALYALDRFVESSTKGAVSLSNLSKVAGQTTQELQKFGLAGALTNAGQSAEEASAKFAAFSKNLYSLQHYGEGNAEGFNKLSFLGKGINFYGKDALQVRQEISDRIADMNDQDATNIISAFGFGPEDLEAFRLSAEEYEKITKKYVQNKETIESLKRTGLAVNTLKLEFSQFKDSVVVDMEPVWIDLIKTLEVVLQLFRSTVIEIKDLARGFDSLSDATKQWAEGLAVVLAAALAPVMATLAAVFLLIDDYVAYKHGGKSVIGAISGKAKSLTTVEVPQPDGTTKTKGYGELTTDDLSAQIKEYGPFGGKRGGESSPAAPSAKSAAQSDIEYLYDISPERDISRFNPNDIRNGTTSKTVEQNNTFNIQGTNADAIAGAVVDKQQQQLNHALSDQNNGSNY